MQKPDIIFCTLKQLKIKGKKIKTKFIINMAILNCPS